jgi:Bacterial RNA polymerase, alpha chain C terminal domain.
MKQLKVCAKGHRYYKSSDCPTCPVCESRKKPSEGFLSLLSAPARRALMHRGIDSLEALSEFTEKEILALHGMGKKSMPVLAESLRHAGLTFRQEEKI